MRKIILLSLLLIPNIAHAACNPPYDAFSSNCTNYNFSLTNFSSVQPIDIDLGGGFHITRFDQSQLNSLGYSQCLVPGGGIDNECIAGLIMQKVNTLGVAPKTFNYPSRSLNSCYQISSTNDASFHYKIDVSSGTLLSGTATGTVTGTSYTNNGCTTGAQIVVDGLSSQGAALGILSVSQIASVPLDGMLPAGKWMKITTAQTVGTPTFSIRGVQAEIIQ